MILRRRPAISRLIAILKLLLLFSALGATAARAADPSPALAQRIGELVPMLNGKGDIEAMFAPSFLTAVPRAQVEAISAQMVGQYGAAQKIERIEAKDASVATAFVRFERAVAKIDIVLDPAPPHRITGLLISDVQVSNDSAAAIGAELSKLPGATSIAIARLGGTDSPQFILAQDADRPMAVGSSYKLFLLAALSQAVQAGERRWGDVVPLERHSIPSGVLQTWPLGSPLTLHSLASLMISVSDNSAADAVLHLLGREKVEQLLPALGIKAPEKLRPLLSTREASLLKAGGEPDLLSQWEKGDEAQRRDLLDTRLATLPVSRVDIAKLAAAPAAIETVEWFASTSDLIRVMDWLRRNGGEQTLAILAINPGVGPAAASKLQYLGYKGGSEIGVLNMTFLARDKTGAWHAISGSWNDPSKALDDNRFISLMGRAVGLTD